MDMEFGIAEHMKSDVAFCSMRGDRAMQQLVIMHEKKGSKN